MATSGGNVATYLTIAGDYDLCKIHNIVKELTPDLFSKSWWPSPFTFIPSYFIGYYTGSIYDHGSGIYGFFEKYLDGEKIKSKEIWTGTLNRGVDKPEFFCNLNARDSKVKAEKFRGELLDCLPLSYMNENTELISKVSLASATIPTYVKEQYIRGVPYVDGGIYYASPLTPMYDTVYDFRNTHIIYVSSFDLDSDGDKSRIYSNLLENSTLTAQEMIRSLCIQDRMTGINMVKGCHSLSDVKCISVEGTHGNLRILYREMKKRRRAMLELYPLNYRQIKLDSFTSEDISSIIDETILHYGCRLWYV